MSSLCQPVPSSDLVVSKTPCTAAASAESWVGADLGQLAVLRNLRALKLPGSHQLSTRGLKSLSMLTGLTCLDLAGVLISAPRGLASLLDTFPHLANLGLQGCR